MNNDMRYYLHAHDTALRDHSETKTTVHVGYQFFSCRSSAAAVSSCCC